MSNHDITPDHLMRGFSRNRLVPSILMALAVHAVFIGVFSIGSLRAMMDPDWKQETGIPVAAPATAEPAAPAATPVEPPAPVVTTPTAPATPAADDIPEDRRDTDVVRAITSLPEEGETPEVPDLGISLDEINPR